jgi:hypothetical protein
MASEPTRDPAKDHLITPKNSALMIVDYLPVQTVHPSLNSIAQIHAKDVMNICSSQEEIGVKLLPAAATDEMLVEVVRLGNRPAFAELWERHSNRAFKVANRISKKTRRCGRHH